MHMYYYNIDVCPWLASYNSYSQACVECDDVACFTRSPSVLQSWHMYSIPILCWEFSG